MTWLSSCVTAFAAKPYRARTTNNTKNVLGCFVGILAFFALPSDAKELPDAHDLIVKSLASGEKNEQQLRTYLSRTRSDLKRFEQNGSLKTEEIKTFDDVFIDGFHVRALVAKNDKPLDGADRAKEDSRIAKLIASRKRETPAQRERRLAEAKEKQEKGRRFSHELLEAFDFRIVGEETLNGRKAWVLEAVPHPGYKPKELKAELFLHLSGRIWIDREDLLWVKADATATEAFALGFAALAKLDKGAHLFFEQMRLPDGTWVAVKTGLKANARVAMLTHVAIENLTTSENFRKVPPETRLQDAKDDF